MAQPTKQALTTEIPACLSLSKAQLTQRYSATGRFYQVESKSMPHKPFRCREMLEIFRPGSAGLECDAVFVMMNPGGSQPLEASGPTSLEEATLVLTRPDDTQYQLMRLMEAFGWEHVRVLNLSDVREAESTDLPALLSRFSRDHKHDGHSVFSATRQAGLAPLLMRKLNSPVILAWGVSPKLKNLAEQALSPAEVPWSGRAFGAWTPDPERLGVLPPVAAQGQGRAKVVRGSLRSHCSPHAWTDHHQSAYSRGKVVFLGLCLRIPSTRSAFATMRDSVPPYRFS